jgi:hypothetical protein
MHPDEMGVLRTAIPLFVFAMKSSWSRIKQNLIPNKQLLLPRTISNFISGSLAIFSCNFSATSWIRSGKDNLANQYE